MKNGMAWKSFDFSGSATDIAEHFCDEPFSFLLESSLFHPLLGRYSFIGYDPFFVARGKRGSTLDDLRTQFAHAMQLQRPVNPFQHSPFPAGLMGYMSYDFGLTFEDIPRTHNGSVSIPDYVFGFYDSIITIDHLKQKLHISSTGLPERTFAKREKRAEQRIETIIHKLSKCPVRETHTSARAHINQNRKKIVFKSDFSRQEYIQAVKKILENIRCGDIYQVNLSQRFCFDTSGFEPEGSPFDMYACLSALSPSCFGGYFNCGNFHIMSSSPERFIKLAGDRVETRPMKGTRPRGNSRRNDLWQKRDLLRSKKDKAELLMITDLERNDLGRACSFGSVRVKEMRTLEQYATVFQTTATVEGRLQRGKDCFDLLHAAFPGGSITGCPKIRAMDIIKDIEPVPRTIYTGSMGYINCWGDMDFNILIRTLLMHGKKIYFHVGGGIVADSNPEDEYTETLVKARAMQDCLARIFTHHT